MRAAAPRRIRTKRGNPLGQPFRPIGLFIYPSAQEVFPVLSDRESVA